MFYSKSKEKEFTIKDGYFLKLKKKWNTIYCSIYNTNELRPIAVIPISLKNKKVFYFKNDKDAECFLLMIISGIIDYCNHEEEKRK